MKESLTSTYLHIGCITISKLLICLKKKNVIYILIGIIELIQTSSLYTSNVLTNWVLERAFFYKIESSKDFSPRYRCHGLFKKS